MLVVGCSPNSSFSLFPSSFSPISPLRSFPMRLLDRYLLRELIIPFCVCLAGFLIFWTAFNLFQELDNIRDHRMLALDVVQYYVIKSPAFLVIVLPVALLLALLYSLTTHARHNELTAIRCAGVS